MLRLSPQKVRIRTAAWFPLGLVISTDASLVELAATCAIRRGELSAGYMLKTSNCWTTISPATLAEMRKNGVRAATSFPVPRSGSCYAREVVREALQNHISVSTARVEIRERPR